LEEFLRLNYNFITRSVEILAAITGIFLFKKYKHSASKYFIYFLVYLAVCDFIGTYTYYINDNGIFRFLKGTYFEYNYWWSTVFWKIGSILFFSFYYQKILKIKVFKKILRYIRYLFFAFSVGLILFNLDEFFTKSFVLISVFGLVIILLCVIFYFYEILRGEKILTFYKSIGFYISTAILVWWMVITPLMFYDIYFSTADWNFILLKWQIYLMANIFMYGTFTFALIWCQSDRDQLLNRPK